jgi:hypothetical protein
LWQEFSFQKKKKLLILKKKKYHANAIAHAGQIIAEHANILRVHARSER